MLFQDPFAEYERDGHHVRSQHTCDTQGDDSIEGGGGADIDQGEKEADNDCCSYRTKR